MERKLKQVPNKRFQKTGTQRPATKRSRCIFFFFSPAAQYEKVRPPHTAPLSPSWRQEGAESSSQVAQSPSPHTARTPFPRQRSALHTMRKREGGRRRTRKEYLIGEKETLATVRVQRHSEASRLWQPKNAAVSAVPTTFGLAAFFLKTLAFFFFFFVRGES